jgi:hypothetical protein
MCRPPPENRVKRELMPKRRGSSSETAIHEM